MRGHGQGQRRWRHGRRAVRMLEPALLLLLHYGPAHGYTFLEQLGQFGLGDLNPSAVYRTLRDMEEKEWVTSTWDEERSQGPPRRVYRITELGDEVLALWTQDLAESRRRIGYLLNVYERHMEESEGEYH
jgi:PadR family transcriptional regulator PadR